MQRKKHKCQQGLSVEQKAALIQMDELSNGVRDHRIRFICQEFTNDRECLSEWEIGFIFSLTRWLGGYSLAQEDKLGQIYARLLKRNKAAADDGVGGMGRWD